MISQDMGEVIRRRRLDLGLSQARAAAAAGLSQQHLSLIETGAVEADLRTLRRIARALGLEVKVELARSAIPERFASLERFNAWQSGEAPIGAAQALRLSDELARLLPPASREAPAERAGAWKRWRADLARVRA
ncbi:MAG: helix-turn-helix transcriptional regulator [Elusimicrobia bacterium]|nr:helix-turn-helix transcriptional regulator [Elusimicrobiota bacterium]